MRLLVDGVVLLVLEARDDLVDDLVLVARPLALAADDEGGARLVDEDGVDLVDDGVLLAGLLFLKGEEFNVVAELVDPNSFFLPLGVVRPVAAAFPSFFLWFTTTPHDMPRKL